jgi:hypothetical protein
MAAPPISWLQFAQQEIDRVFGDGYAAANPRLVASVVESATSDWAAATIRQCAQGRRCGLARRR